MSDAQLRSVIQLNAGQRALLAWIVDGCAPGVYPEDEFSHRISARALETRGLVDILGHGKSWRATPTERGRRWPEATAEDRRERERQERPAQRIVAEQGSVTVETGALGRAMRRMPRSGRTPKKIPVTQVNKQETYMRYKVVVSRVQVAEKWVRATDEEDAARKVHEEFAKPYSYFGNWETKASEVEIIEAEQTTVIHPSKLAESGPMLLSLKDAAVALGIAPDLAVHRAHAQLSRMGSGQVRSRTDPRPHRARVRPVVCAKVSSD